MRVLLFIGKVSYDLDPLITFFISVSATFGTTRAGNPVIQVGPYRFKRMKGKGPNVRWNCIKYNAHCRAALITLDDVIIKTQNEHNH